MINRISILISFALRDVSKSRTILALTIVSLSSAFTAVFISSGVLEGFRQAMVNGEIGASAHLHIKPEEGEYEIENISKVESFLDKMSNVETYSVRSVGQADFQYKDKIIRPYAILGVDPSDEAKASENAKNIIEGRFLVPGDAKSVVIGLTFADALEGLGYDGKYIGIGEKVNVRMVNGDWEKFTVAGIFDAKSFIPNWWAVFSKEQAENIDGRGKDSLIAVKLKNPDRMEEDRRLIQNSLPGIAVFTWEEEAGYIKDIISAVIFVTGSISKLLIETTFVIMSVIIFINVFQRRRQIGIMKSMGASNRFVVAIYVFETLVYAVLSYTIGFCIFMLIYIHSTNNPIPLLIGDFRIIFVKSEAAKLFFVLVGASLAGSVVPSYIAARTRIADVIRGLI